MQGLSSIVVEPLALRTPLTRKRSLDVGLLSCKLYLASRRHSTTEEERQVLSKIVPYIRAFMNTVPPQLNAVSYSFNLNEQRIQTPRMILHSIRNSK